MKGTRPGHLPPPSPAVDRPQRPCAHPGCSTMLSRYNEGDYCWQHTEIVFPNHRGKRLDRP